MKKQLRYFSLIIALFAFISLEAIPTTNLMAGWDGNGITGAASKPNDVGWLNTSTAMPWTVANGSGGCRFRDSGVTGGYTAGSFTFDDGGAVVTTRQLMLRYDNAAYSSSKFAYPVTLEASSSYTLTFDFVCGGSATPPQSLNVGAGLLADGTDRVSSQVFTSSTSATKYVSCSYTFISGTTAGTYYITIGGGAAAWFGVNNFNLVKNTTVDKTALSALITTATNMKNNPEPVGASTAYTDLDNALIAANAVFNNANATVLEVSTQETALTASIAAVNGAIALQTRITTWTALPYDATSVIVNPSFETNGANGWTNVGGLWSQTNSSFPYKAGNVYFEKWQSSGSWSGLKISQIIKNLPNGDYKLIAAALNNPITTGGAFVFANDVQTEVFTPNDYKVKVTVTNNQLEVGFRVDNGGNYIATDNFRLYFLSDGSPYIYTEPTTLSFNPTTLVKTFEVTGGYLTENVTLVPPTGISLDKTTLTPAEVAAGVTVTATFNNSVAINAGSITITSGTVSKSLTVNASIDPAMVLSVPRLGLDELNTTASFTVSGSNLVNDITITAPAGIVVSPATISKGTGTVTDVTVNVTYDATTTGIDGNIVLTTGAITSNVGVKATLNSACFTPLYSNLTNIITDPFVNDFANFGGWGDRSINTDPANVYCGARSGMISGGSLDYVLTGKLTNNTTYRIKAMVKAASTSAKVGVFGWGGADINTYATVVGEWAPIDFTFTTGTLAGTYGTFFNGSTGSYIDNWEMYDITSTITGNNLQKENSVKAYVRNNNIVISLDRMTEGNAQVAVYNLNGMMLANENMACAAGANVKTLNTNLSSGVYFVQIQSEAKLTTLKIVK